MPRLTSRDPERFWTSGHRMTELTGGSDVGASLTRAERTDDGWALFGRKWFTSAASAPMALTLARPVSSPAAGAAWRCSTWRPGTARGDSTTSASTG